MSYSNGLLSETRNFQGGKDGKDGKDGLPGVGFKLTPSGDFDLQKKRLTNVADGTTNSDAITKHQVDTLATQLRADSLQVDGSSHMTGDLDLRGNKLILPGEINMNRKLIKNLDVDETDDFSAVNMATLKKFSSSSSSSSSSSGDIDLKDQFNVKNSKPQNFSHLAANYDNLVSYSDVKNIFLSRKETFAMEADLDMGNQTIFNVKDPTIADQGANKKYVDALETSTNTKFATAQSQRNLKADRSYVDATFLKLSGGTMISDINAGGNKLINLPSPTTNSEPATKSYVDSAGTTITSNLSSLISARLPLAGGKMTGSIDMDNNKVTNLPNPTSLSEAATKGYVDKSHVSQSGNYQNVFLYLMKDVNESSSESNIKVLGIKKVCPISSYHF